MTREFTPAEAMEFFQKMWNPLGLPMPAIPGMPGAGQDGGRSAAQAAPEMPMPPFMPFPPSTVNAFATFDPDEVAKKITEFKTIEAWLSMQIGMLQMTISTMEMQKASLEALRAQAQGGGAGSGSRSGKGRK